MSGRWTTAWKPAAERALIAAISAVRLDALGRRLHARGVVMVMYHGFTDRRVHEGIQNHEQKHVHAEAFRAHLEFLKAHYHVMPLAELVRASASGAPLPPRPAVVTVDDGYRSTYAVAYPILKELGVPAAVFLATEFVDERRFLWTDRVEYAVNGAAPGPLQLDAGAGRLRFDLDGLASRIAADRMIRSTIKKLPQESRAAVVDALETAAGLSLADAPAADAIYQPMSWDEAREMAASGLVALGSHTHTHVILSRCRDEQTAHELRLSKRIIEDRLGRPCDLFCYPNGRSGDFNATTRRLVMEAGYSCALTTVYGMNPPTPDVYELKRYNLGKPLAPGEIAVRLSGLL